MHTNFADLGEEMARVRAAVMVRRSDSAKKSDLLMAANKLEIAKTLQSYSLVLGESLFPR